MNILASYDWLKEYVDLKETPEQFAARVSLSGPGVERLYPQGQDLNGIVLGQITDVSPHPQADKLRVTSVDVGAEQLSIVCGGSNLAVGQWVAVAKIGAWVKWHGEGEPVELKPTEIRGVRSEGMICAASEIGLFDAFPHTEREIMDLGWLHTAVKKSALKAGTPLAVALGLEGDTVMDIEVTTNRPDASGMVGLAREAAAILKRPFLWKPVAHPKTGSLPPLAIKVSDKKLCTRYMAAMLKDVQVAPSPWWLKRRLMSAGIRPINNLVDVTNYVMLELAQPMHVFDADKIVGTLHIRKGKTGERMAALDGKTYDLDESMLIIADDEKPVAIAGVMGSEGSSVTLDTHAVIFESACFDSVSVRRTARKLNLYSDAQLRFEKGLSVQAPADALARAIELCHELANGVIASSITDERTADYKPLSFKIGLDECQALIGVPLPKSEMTDTLKRLGFRVTATQKSIEAVVPWWRDHDIESGRDLVEEIARIYGYTNIPAVFPTGISPTRIDPELLWEQRVRQLAKGAGMTEVYTYSFVSKDLLEKAGYRTDHLLRVQNPLSSDFEFMRTSLLPSLLEVVHENQERFNEQQLFEVAHAYYMSSADAHALPDERLEMSAAFFGMPDAWKRAKGFVEHLLEDLGITSLRWQALQDDSFWHPGRSAQVFSGEHLLGTIGELHPSVAARYKFERRIALVHLPLEQVFAHATTQKRAIPLPVFPEIKRDLALVIDRSIEVQQVIDALRQQDASGLLKRVEWFDTYRGDRLPADKKSIALHLSFGHPDRTLEAKEVDEAMLHLTETAKTAIGAEQRT